MYRGAGCRAAGADAGRTAPARRRPARRMQASSESGSFFLGSQGRSQGFASPLSRDLGGFERIGRREIEAESRTLAHPRVVELPHSGALELAAIVRIGLEVQAVVEHDGDEQAVAIHAMAAEHALHGDVAETRKQLDRERDERAAHLPFKTSRKAWNRSMLASISSRLIETLSTFTPSGSLSA